MTDEDARQSAKATPPIPKPKAPTLWKLWIGVALFVAYVVGVNIQAHSPEGQARTDASWRSVVQQIGDDACDAYEWSQGPGQCEEMAKDARDRATRRFESYRK